MAQAHLELVYIYLCSVYQAEGELPTVAQIMDACHMTQSQVRSALRELRQRGWLTETAPVVITSGEVHA